MGPAVAWVFGCVCGVIVFIGCVWLWRKLSTKLQKDRIKTRANDETIYNHFNRQRKIRLDVNFGSHHIGPLGMDIGYGQRTHVVCGVHPGSLAEQKGVLVGDLILEVRGHPVGNLGASIKMCCEKLHLECAPHSRS